MLVPRALLLQGKVPYLERTGILKVMVRKEKMLGILMMHSCSGDDRVVCW
jgi:hypothetical protein